MVAVVTTAAGNQFDPELFRAHAARLDALRARLGQVRATVAEFERDQAAFGRLCGWILTGLEERYVRHGELVAYVEETFVLTVRGLTRVADGDQRLADFLGMPDEDAEPEAYEAPRSATEIVEGVLEVVAGREWVEPELAEAAPVAEFAVPVDETVAALRSAGLDRALTHVASLRQMLDDLTGMPDVVAKQADLWTGMAADLRVIGVDLRRCLDEDFGAVGRPDVRSYLALMANNVEALRGLDATCTAMTVITKAAGDLILLTRDIVRGLIGDLVARVIVWAAGATVVPLPVVVARLATVVHTAWRIDDYLTALVTSIANLSQSIDG